MTHDQEATVHAIAALLLAWSEEGDHECPTWPDAAEMVAGQMPTTLRELDRRTGAPNFEELVRLAAHDVHRANK